jgi:hypothetical protein
MSDQTLGPEALAPPPAGLEARSRRGLSAGWVVGITAVVALALIARFVRSEGGPATIAYATFVTAALGAFVVVLTGRILPAALVALSVTVIVSIAAMVKLRLMNMVLHAYDLLFYLTSLETLAYLWQDYRFYLGSAVGAVATAGIATWIAYRIDTTRIRRDAAFVVFLALCGATGLAAWAMGERRHSQFEYEGQYISSFFLSFSETFEAMRRGQIIEAAEHAPGPALSVPFGCEAPVPAPHVILIHHESIVPPSLFATLSYDKSLDSFFKSDDGLLHKLRVETYGGASTLTEFSLLTGLSTYSFGGMRQFVQTMMAGKIKDTLPQALTRCGYREVVFYPMLRNFVMAGKFFNSIGLHQIYDAKDQGARIYNERDRFYYGNALNEIERHIAGSKQPLFAFIETMATHWPYNVTYEPETVVPGGGPGTHPEMHEYLRRLAMAKMDYEHLVAELKRRFPGERFLIVRYGDHHPMATRMLLGFKEETEAEDVLADRDSIAFQTFYAVNGVNYKVPSPPAFRSLDVPYLGVVLQQAAGLPMSDPWRERQRMMAACGGRYADCADQSRVLSFHRRMIDSGLVQAR